MRMRSPRNLAARLRAWWHRPSLRARLAHAETEVVRMAGISEAILQAVAASFRERDARLEERLGVLHNETGLLAVTLAAALDTIGEANEGRRHRLAARVAERRHAYWGGLAATAIAWAGAPDERPEQVS